MLKIRNRTPLPVIDTTEAWVDEATSKEAWCEAFGCVDAELVAQQSGANFMINYYETDEIPITEKVQQMSPLVYGYDSMFAGFNANLSSVPRSAILGIHTNGVNPLT